MWPTRVKIEFSLNSNADISSSPQFGIDGEAHKIIISIKWGKYLILSLNKEKKYARLKKVDLTAQDKTTPHAFPCQTKT